MCEFCLDDSCKLTKQKVLELGSILERNVSGIMREFDGNNTWGFKGYTYSFNGVPAYDSYSAIVPDADSDNPHDYTRFVFDEDSGCNGTWQSIEVQDPSRFITEQEFLNSVKDKGGKG